MQLIHRIIPDIIRAIIVYSQVFLRIEPPVGDLTAGRGIGLNLIKQKMESIGGKIEVESEFGNSTCFTLIIPYSDRKKVEKESMINESGTKSPVPQP